MVQQLTEGVWWVDLMGVNAYLVEDDVLTLVDAGMPWHAGTIERAIEEIGYEPTDLTRVLVTHYDFDHVGGLSGLRPSTIHAGERDADLVAKRQTPSFSNRKSAFQRMVGMFTQKPTAPVTPLRDGEEIGSFTAIATPGHTTGHVAYVSSELDVAFVGDLVTSDGSGLSPSPWYMTQDTDVNRESIEHLVEEMPAVDVVAPGHGPPLSDGGYGALAALVD